MSAVAEPINPPVISLTRSLGLSGLVDEMTRGCAMPVGTLQVAALLETTGITDAIARRRYGFSDVFALAEALADRLPRAAPSGFEAAKEGALASQRGELLRDISRGPLALLPMVLLSLIIAVYQGIGKWPPGHVLALSMAMVGSLLVTSGFVQAASRKGASYLCQGYVNASASYRHHDSRSRAACGMCQRRIASVDRPPCHVDRGGGHSSGCFLGPCPSFGWLLACSSWSVVSTRLALR